MSNYADLIERLQALQEAATPGPYRAHDHKGMARVGADPAEWVGYAWIGRITANSSPDGSFDAGWLSTDRRKDCDKEYRERASADAHFVAEALNNLPALLDAISRLEREKAEAIRMIRLLLDGIGHPTNDGWYMVSIHIEDVNAARDLLSRTQEQTA